MGSQRQLRANVGGGGVDQRGEVKPAVGVDTPTLMRPAEAAAVFGVNPKTVSRWARAGHLRSVRTPGGHTRIYAVDVRALAAHKTEEPQ